MQWLGVFKQRRRIVALAVGIICAAGLAGAGWWLVMSHSSGIPADKQPYPAMQIGKATPQQLHDQVGDSYTTYSSNGYHVESQQTDKSPYKPDLFYFQNGKLVMKEQWYEPTIYYVAESHFLEQYGKPEYTLYPKVARDVPVRVDAYPGKGMAAYIQDDIKAVWHVQFFAPMSLSDYLKTWGEDLSQSKPSQPFMPEPPGK